MTEFLNAFQIGVTLSFVLMCWLLLRTWGVSFRKAMAGLTRRHKLQSEEWLIMGIVIGFAANALDNLYWGINWTQVHLLDSYDTRMMDLGPVANIFFRQIPGIVAVYFHLRAAASIAGGEYNTNRRTLIYLIAGGVLGGIVLLIPAGAWK